MPAFCGPARHSKKKNNNFAVCPLKYINLICHFGALHVGSF